MRKVRPLLFSLALAVGCVLGSPTTVNGVAVSTSALPAFPTMHAARLWPPLAYRRWWKDVERCTGVRDSGGVSFSRVRFYVDTVAKDGFVFPEAPGIVFTGYAWSDRLTMLVAGNLVMDSMLVRHEMAHLKIGNARMHDSTVFRGSCKDLVVCGYYCQRDTTHRIYAKESR